MALDADRTSSQDLADGHGLKSFCSRDPAGSTHIVGQEQDVLIRWGVAVNWRLTGGNGRFPRNICVKERGQTVLSWREKLNTASDYILIPQKISDQLLPVKT